MSATANDANTVYVSAVTAWEIATKHRIGKLPSVAGYVGRMEETVLQEGFALLPITMHHGDRAGSIDGPHKDPFDRILAAQALLGDLILVSRDTVFDRYGVQRLW